MYIFLLSGLLFTAIIRAASLQSDQSLRCWPEDAWIYYGITNYIYPHYWHSQMGANSIDPDQMQNVATDLELHCLSLYEQVIR